MKAKVWLYPGLAAWYFVTLPEKESGDIKRAFEGMTAGFGSLPVNVTVGQTTWKTSIFPDRKGAYMLPLKADVRKKEKIQTGSTILFTIQIRT